MYKGTEFVTTRTDEGMFEWSSLVIVRRVETVGPFMFPVENIKANVKRVIL